MGLYGGIKKVKYQQQLAGVKPVVDSAKNILIALPAQASVDLLASGLAFYLSLKQAGKEASIVTESPIVVGNTNLYGVGDIKNSFPQSKGGDFVLTLQNVVMPDGSVPALEKLDWYPEGADLNLVFHVVPGQRFEPAKVDTRYTSGSFDLIVTIGVSSLSELGNLYAQNQAVFDQGPLFNIDNNAMNSSFGQHRLLDSTTNFSQMIAQVLPELGLPVDGDIASNVLAGVYAATNSLTQGVGPETFMVVGQAMQAGGTMSQQPAVSQPVQAPPAQPVAPQPVPQPAPQVPPVMPTPNPMTPPPITQPTSSQFDLKMFMPPNFNPVPTEQPLSPNPGLSPVTPPNPVVSGETEVQPATPVEQTYEDGSFNPQPDWLTPKVFKGSGGVE